jgi:hypothetical protein
VLMLLFPLPGLNSPLKMSLLTAVVF